MSTVHASSWVVTNVNDSGPGSLRQAIADAVAGDAITFDPSLAGQTIILESTLLIEKDLKIDGSGLDPQLTIDGNHAYHIETLLADLEVSDLTITHGYSSSYGGGILSRGYLRLIRATLINNVAEGNGGGIYSQYALEVIDSAILQNHAAGGGGISFEGLRFAVIRNSTLSGNSAEDLGGGLYITGSPDQISIENSTFADNSATIYGHEIFNRSGYADLVITNSIFVCTSQDDICYELAFYDTANSILGEGTLADFGLAELADNGGPTQTMALLPGSPLIDAGVDGYSCTDTDQRGMRRPQGSHCDIGAYEATLNPVVTKLADTDDGVCDSDCSLREAVDDAVAGDVITFFPSLAGQTITLGYNLNIDKDLTIDGSELSSQVIVSGGGNLGHWEIFPGVKATISHITITDSHYGIMSRGDLTILNSTVKENTNYSGGAISSYNGSLTVQNSTITQNHSYYGGGAIYIGGGGNASIINSTVTGNDAVYDGGGIQISDGAAVEIINSTFAGNSAPRGSEISISGDASTLTLSNSVFACTPPNTNCYDYLPGSVTSTNGILGVGTLADFGLTELADNGGPTQTMALLSGSSLIDAGDDTSCQDIDQRGVIRPQGNHCDIGAYEYMDIIPPAAVQIRVASPNPSGAATVNFNVTFTEPVTGVDASDFVLDTSGLSGASILGVSGAAQSYTVTVGTGSGSGTLSIDLLDNDSIVDILGNPLGGIGELNGSFNNGETYSIVKTAPKPGVPTLLAPASGQLLNTLRPVLDWQDSVPAANRYQVQVSTNNTFTALVIDETGVLTSTFTPASDLTPGRLYYWRVRAFNIPGDASNWSAVRNFKTPLAQPVLVSPAIGELLLTDRPAFSWTIVSGADQYNLQISAASNFSTLLVNVTLNTTSYTPTRDLPQNKILYARVRAKTSAVMGPWSEKRPLYTGNPPTVPMLTSPANGTLLKDYTPLFNWSNSTTPASTTFQHYEIQVDDTIDFSSPVLSALSNISEYTPEAVEALPSNTRFYWRVRAVNLVNENEHVSAWSPIWSFRTILSAPQALFVTFASQRMFEWEDATGPGAITGYTIQISTNASFSTLLVNSTTVNSYYDMTSALPTGRTIYWRVRVNGVNGPSAWSVTQFFIP